MLTFLKQNQVTNESQIVDKMNLDIAHVLNSISYPNTNKESGGVGSGLSLSVNRKQ